MCHIIHMTDNNIGFWSVCDYLCHIFSIHNQSAKINKLRSTSI